MNDNCYLDLLGILSVVLQLQIMEEQKYQSDNDDIMEELQRQDKKYLDEILRNQRLILEQLNKLTQKGWLNTLLGVGSIIAICP